MSQQVINQVLEKPELYAGVLLDMIQKIGFAAVVALGLVLFLCHLILKLIRNTMGAYQDSIKYLNDQNKRYQDYFLDDRTKSGKLHLGEDKPQS